MLFDHQRDRCVSFSTVLPTPRFSRGIGLVLYLFRGGKIAVAVFWASLHAHAAISQKQLFFTSRVTIKSCHILRLINNKYCELPIQSLQMFLNIVVQRPVACEDGRYPNLDASQVQPVSSYSLLLV